MQSSCLPTLASPWRRNTDGSVPVAPRAVVERARAPAGRQPAVRSTTVREPPTAVVVATTTWERFPTEWKGMLDQVWAFLRGTDLRAPDGHNVMFYKDDVRNVEVGVEVTRAFEPSGRVVPSTLPAGRVATTVHRGSYDGLAAAHLAVLSWCAAHDHKTACPRR